MKLQNDKTARELIRKEGNAAVKILLKTAMVGADKRHLKHEVIGLQKRALGPFRHRNHSVSLFPSYIAKPSLDIFSPETSSDI